MAYRDLIGRKLLKGTIHPASSKIKNLFDEKKPGVFKCKVCVFMAEGEKGLRSEHCVLKFLNREDQQEFMKAFSEILEKATESTSA